MENHNFLYDDVDNDNVDNNDDVENDDHDGYDDDDYIAGAASSAELGQHIMRLAVHYYPADMLQR